LCAIPRSGRIAVIRSKTASEATRDHRVACVVGDGLSVFEFGVACEVFGPYDPPLTDGGWYRLQVCAERPGPVSTEMGFSIDAPHGLGPLDRADTVVVAPVEHAEAVGTDVLKAIRRAHRRGARIVSLCTGAFVLAEAGLLDGRRATTHWMEADELATRWPSVTVDPGVLYVDDGDVLTSAGAAASIDLCLYLVRQDWGSEVANALAKQLVVSPHRDGGQAQYIEAPVPKVADSDLLGASFEWMQQNLHRDIDIATLAGLSSMSARSFARTFRARTGTTPYQWVIRQRLLLAQQLLETTDLSVDVVATRSGFGSAINLRKHFQRGLHTTPQTYRRSFREQRQRAS
jgi:AraC family transcriptional activator FtrA